VGEKPVKIAHSKAAYSFALAVEGFNYHMKKLLLFVALAAYATAAPFYFQSTLNGAQEVPSFSTPGSGTASGILNGAPGSWVFTYTVTYSGLTGTIAAPFAHIHNAAVGSNGPIVHDLDGANLAPIAGSTSGTIMGDWRFDDASRPLTDALANQLLAGNLYFNIHTTARAAGEIRGQIVPEPSTYAMLAGGFAVLVYARRRSKR
jgi:hypothetical protein